MSAEALARRAATALLASDRVARRLGVEVVEVGPGHAVIRMQITEEMVNGLGTVHGGVVFTLADIAYGAACNTHGEITVSRAAEVIHLAPAHPGEVLVATACERWREGRNGVYDVTVRREGGGVVAEFRGQTRTVGGTLVPGDGAGSG